MQSNKDDNTPMPDVEIYRVIYDKLPQGVVVVKNDEVQYANQALADIAGVSIKELYSWGMDDILGVLAGEDPEAVKTLYQDTAKGITTEGLLQFSFNHRNGETRHIEVIPTIISVEGETIYHAIITDVTMRVRAEAALRENEERFRQTFDAIPDPAYVWERNEDGTIALQMVNQAMMQFSRGLAEEYIGRPPEDLFPDNSEMSSMIRTTMNEGGKARAEIKFKISSIPAHVESRRLIVDYTRPADNLVVMITTDVTDILKAQDAIRESEERFRSMAESIQDGITIMEGNPVVYVNDRACEIFGHPRKEFMKLTTLDLVAPEERERVGAIVAKSMATGEYPDQLDFWTIRKDGTRRYVSNRFAFTTKDDGTPIQFVITTDITERMEAYEATKEAHARAELFNDLMAHDLNNIHQGIMSSLELILMRGNLPPALISQVDLALEQVKRGSEIIANVRKFSRVVEEPLELSKFDVDPVLLSAEVMVTSAFPEKRVNVNPSFQKGDFKVFADEFLVDAFFNILHNAVKHDKSNDVTIEVKARITEDRNSVDILFEDFGPGIKDSKKATLFSRIKEDGEVAAGIGLTLVQRIVRRYGGEVGVEDRVKGDYSKGTCFIVRLPLVK
ncbi:MAG: PAS domain S-box protein [Candidatus Thorarchaeota archaeon]|jgi:PAS domain S-box-containing protein